MGKRGSAKKGSDLKPPPETWLARYRREAGVNQYELSWATGISVRNLQRLESGAHENPPVRYLISCAAALDLEDWHLLLEDKWSKPLPGTRPVRRASNAKRPSS